MKLHQLLAVEKDLKGRVHANMTKIYQTFQKAQLFNGLSRTYAKKDDSGEDLPSERTKVTASVDEMLKDLAEQMTEAMDYTASKDWANTIAKADVEIDGKILIKDAPVTHLLYLESELKGLKDEIAKLPELDPSTDWSLDASTGTYKSSPLVTVKTAKVQEPIVLYQATEQHPAQTQLITRDVTVGHWTTIKESGAIPVKRKRLLLERVNALQDAVKIARESANSVEAPKKIVSKPILDYLFS